MACEGGRLWGKVGLSALKRLEKYAAASSIYANSGICRDIGRSGGFHTNWLDND